MKPRNGEILVFFLAVMALSVLLVTSSMTFQRGVIHNAKQLSSRQDASYLAEAGLEKGFTKYKVDQTYVGETLNLGNGTVTTAIASGSTANEKILTATATVNSQTKRLRVKLATQPDGVAVAFHYAIQAGSGGFSIGNNTIVNGNVYSNQNIGGSNGAKVNGDASAVGTITNLTVTGQKLTGQPAQAMPPFDAPFWKSKAQAGGTITGDYTPVNNSSIGPLYVSGNINFGTNTVTIKGPIYASGNISFGNGPIINVASSLGTESVMLVAEGTISFGNSITVTNNSQGGHLLVASTNISNNAIAIGNNAVSINAPLYAPNGGISVFNNAHAVAFTAKLISLGNGVTIDYDTGLATAVFTSGPSGTWTVSKGTYQEY